ncbi:hypothetical protein BO70DRAFT_289373 [Aspergillus heteromorphus CBS 117.55]|uniref:Uncharacterized protein n=1 Tax=Aspergillus heteromorphus CBS 117.55 TaxID=1448321 RepID=A0A317WIE3_9EURO|nr:uncharacterized protein BO70DRAFT_289373 [Aspergillus heteromorphus CBS 117.55]PWY86069.1 hypothetical protein BO70DRAFT_289373 [Aspergillus heteromorphus CBS 117.55]
MKTFTTLAAFAAGTNALVGRGNTCCFHLTASGGASGTIGQLGDGQNRIGGGLPETQFCIDSNGSIADSSGRGCVVTSSTTQFQCDLGVPGTSGFSISSSGELEYKGDADFVACQTGDGGELNLYTTESSSVTGCENIKLTADSCSGTGAGSGAGSSSVPAVSSTPAPGAGAGAGGSSSVPAGAGAIGSSTAPGGAPSSAPAGPAPSPGGGGAQPSGTAPGGAGAGSSPAPSAPGSASAQPSETSPGGAGAQTSGTSTPETSAAPSGAQASSTATQSSAASCPTDLSGDYEYPHLIVPINSSTPDTAFGSQFFGTVSSTVSTIFNFDIPSSDAGKTCSLIFLLPNKQDLETSSYTFSGDGKVDFSLLSSAASLKTSYSNAPSVQQDYGDFTLSPGNSYLISSFSCPAGETVSYEMKEAGSTYLNFFEDYNPSPLGLYITVC